MARIENLITTPRIVEGKVNKRIASLPAPSVSWPQEALDARRHYDLKMQLASTSRYPDITSDIEVKGKVVALLGTGLTVALSRSSSNREVFDRVCKNDPIAERAFAGWKTAMDELGIPLLVDNPAGITNEVDFGPALQHLVTADPRKVFAILQLLHPIGSFFDPITKDPQEVQRFNLGLVQALGSEGRVIIDPSRIRYQGITGLLAKTFDSQTGVDVTDGYTLGRSLMGMDELQSELKRNPILRAVIYRGIVCTQEAIDHDQTYHLALAGIRQLVGSGYDETLDALKGLMEQDRQLPQTAIFQADQLMRRDPQFAPPMDDMGLEEKTAIELERLRRIEDSLKALETTILTIHVSPSLVHGEGLSSKESMTRLPELVDARIQVVAETRVRANELGRIQQLGLNYILAMKQAASRRTVATLYARDGLGVVSSMVSHLAEVGSRIEMLELAERRQIAMDSLTGAKRALDVYLLQREKEIEQLSQVATS